MCQGKYIALVTEDPILPIYQSWIKSRKITRIFGASSSSLQALISIRLGGDLEKRVPVLILCPDETAANDFCVNLECFNNELQKAALPSLYMPTWERSPYSPIAPSLKTRQERLAVLSSLVFGPAPAILVASLASANQATIPVSFFRSLAVQIKVNEAISGREALISNLLRSGYAQTDLVEDPGTFSARGEIIDIYPPHLSLPVRVELFDTVVERIREFDPSTQRTSLQPASSFASVILPPAREVLINSDTAKSLRAHIKARADQIGIPRKIRDPLLDSVQNGFYPDHSDAWAPFAYADTPCTLWSYVDLYPDSKVLWLDETQCQNDWDAFLEEQKRLSDETTQNELVLPPPEALFVWNDENKQNAQKRAQLSFDKVELTAGEDDSSSFRVTTQSISDLPKSPETILNTLEKKIKSWKDLGFQIWVFATTQSQVDRIRYLFSQRGISAGVDLRLGSLTEGFVWNEGKLAVLTESDILGVKSKKTSTTYASAKKSSSKGWSELQTLSDLSVSDLVVHVLHGIARYQGITRLNLSGAESDFLHLEYANKDKLYLPIYRLNLIQKYVGGEGQVGLDKLGSQHFTKTKEKVKESVKKLAFDLVQLYAQRKLQKGVQFSKRDATFQEFEAKFPYEETPDQLKAIEDVLNDLESGQVMDRLVCGDVGYGKTEVALRAAFKAISEGKQVVVLVPTTILAQQHEQTFRNRMKDYPIVVESLSRFKTKKEQNAILDGLKKGKVDLVIGTHRLLSKDVGFSDLGLIIVDEEHRFGVEHKERLKLLKLNIHVLTLTATPIPRTLYMALSGLREISLINTPPMERLPIRTYVSKYSESMIQRAIDSELTRGGQVFFLHNRVHSIHETVAKIRGLVPAAQIVVAHGQMPEHELEETMMAFYKKRANILICTTIIESGLDLPSANTIIIDRADTLGLAQLYQIRGRVGRSDQRAFAYFLVPASGYMTDEAKQRLEVIQRFVELGSGFSIASHDLEIRGGGDVLGPQQSGSINAVGFDLYTQLLEEAINETQSRDAAAVKPEEKSAEPEIKVPFPTFLSEEYIPNVHLRLSFYRRLSAAENYADLMMIEEEMKDRFGQLPPEAQNVLWMIRLKQVLKQMGISTITVGTEKVSLVAGQNSKLDTSKIIGLVTSRPDLYQLTPDSKLVATLKTSAFSELVFSLEEFLNRVKNF